LTAFEGGILGHGVAIVSSSVSLSHLHITFCYKTLLYRNLNQNCNILYLEHLIYDLYVCTCVFLLHQESLNMILVNNTSFYDGGVTPVAQNNQQNKIRYTFDISRCDEIFDILVLEKIVRILDDRVISSSKELGIFAYCKWHDSFSHNTCD
jgi:hypothetical protein